jgi:hypothetical protein
MTGTALGSGLPPSWQRRWDLAPAAQSRSSSAAGRADRRRSSASRSSAARDRHRRSTRPAESWAASSSWSRATTSNPVKTVGVSRAGRAREGRRHRRCHQQRIDARSRRSNDTLMCRSSARQLTPPPSPRTMRRNRAGQLRVPGRYVRHRPGQLHGRYHGKSSATKVGLLTDRRLGRLPPRRAAVALRRTAQPAGETFDNDTG